MHFRFSPEKPTENGVYFVYASEYINRKDDEILHKIIHNCFLFDYFHNNKWSIDNEHKSYVEAWMPVSELYSDLNRAKNE